MNLARRKADWRPIPNALADRLLALALASGHNFKACPGPDEPQSLQPAQGALS